MANELVKREHDVTIALTNNIIDYQVDSSVKIKYLRPKKEMTCSFRIINLLLLIYKKFLWNLSVRAIIINLMPDVIVASWGSKVEAILRWHGSIPIISSEHNTFDRAHSPKEHYQRFILNNHFNKVVVLTQFDKEFTKKWLNNTIVIYNPLTFHPISLDEYYNSFANRKNILACGRIKAWNVKGFDNLIKAFSSISHYCEGWDLDIAGTYDEASISYLNTLAVQLGVNNRVHFLGFCEDINEVMKSHSIFVLSSRSEGFGMVISEAMAMGCSCVSYALTGPCEIIKDGEDGILVENQNIDALGSELLRLTSDHNLRLRLGKHAIDNVKRFSVEKITDQWVDLFKEVTNHG